MPVTPVMPVTRRRLVAGAVTAALPLAFLTPAAPAAATTCTGHYPVRIADGYAGLYTESSQSPRRPSCSVVTNTATDGTALLIRSTEGLVEPTSDPAGGVRDALRESARQAAQDIVGRGATVVLPGESVILHYSPTNSFTVSIADNRVGAAAKVAGFIASYALRKAIATGTPWLDTALNRASLKSDIAACAAAAATAWNQTSADQTFPELAAVLAQTAQEGSGPCKTAYTTIKGFDPAPAPAPTHRTSLAWQQTLHEAQPYGRIHWRTTWTRSHTLPLRPLILQLLPR
ncbi:hypothetical protein [Streptomyces xanthophaeus]